MEAVTLIKEVIRTRRMTPMQESRINEMMWSNTFDQEAMGYLARLVNMIQDGSIKMES